MAGCVDLRSDTVTRPTRAMLEAMMSAEVGDDVLGDDPTARALEARVAELLGKEAALFTPSGTMANQLAIRSVCEPGDELIVDQTCHCCNYETGAPAALSGCSVRMLRGRRGIFEPEQIREAYRPKNAHFAGSRMVVVENTSNLGGGSVWPLERVAQVRQVCDELGLHLHLDGARLWNAAVASGHSPRAYADCAGTVAVCFSKSLGTPAGSMLAGPRELIDRARRFRKMFGGAMRQVGILAAAALYALDHHIDRLAEDHANARRLAEALAALPGIRLDPASVETNIIVFEIDPQLGTAAEFAAKLRERGVWLLATGPQRLRAVTHLDVSREQIEQAIGVFEALCTAAATA